MVKIKVYINELKIDIKENSTLYEIKDIYNKAADVLILNGHQVKDNINLKENDKITLIEKGRIPTLEELETLLVARHTPNLHNKLKVGKVAILGAGGLGSNIAISLARVGVGKIILADFDIVEPSNLNRQQYYISDIGKYKVDALKEHINKINPFLDLVTHKVVVDKNNMELFEDVDIVIEAFDNPKYKAEIANYCLIHMRDKYLVASSGMAGYYESNIIQTRKIREKFYICGDFVNEAKIGDGLIAPRVAICANHMANLVVRILGGAENG